MKHTLLVLGAIALATGVHAQGPAAPTRRPVDRIVAIVGTTPILWSEVTEAVNQRRAMGAQIPDDSAGAMAYARDIVEQLVDEELLVQRASSDTSIAVSDADLNATVEEQVKQIRSRMSNDQGFISALKSSGFGNQEEYRRWLLEQARRNALQQRYVEKLRREGKLIQVAVPESDIVAAFERQKANLPKRPPSITFRQIVVPTRPSEQARTIAHAKADSLRAQLKTGANFEQLAKRESMDTTSRDVGGDLGWNRRETLVPEFAAVLFSLQPGQIGVVETSYGVHVIRVDRVRPGEVKARQILIRPHYDSSDVVRTKLLADSVLRLWKGGTPYDTLLKRFHDHEEVEGSLEPFPRDSLPASYATAFNGKSDGAFVEPFQIQDPQRGVPKFVIAQVLQSTPAGEYTLAELHDRIRAQLQDERSFRRVIDQLKKETYVSIMLEGIAGSAGKSPH